MFWFVVGSFVNGYEHGNGTHTSAFTGETYKGDWKHGMKSGNGVILYCDDDQGREQYSGDFLDGLQHGNGRLTFANGDVYEVRCSAVLFCDFWCVACIRQSVLFLIRVRIVCCASSSPRVMQHWAKLNFEYDQSKNTH